jgi:hypothetical protein
MAEADAPLSGLLPWTPPRRPGLTVLDRSAPVDGGQRALQQAILRGFATTGAAPAPDQLAEVIRPQDHTTTRAGRHRARLLRPATTCSLPPRP